MPRTARLLIPILVLAGALAPALAAVAAEAPTAARVRSLPLAAIERLGLGAVDLAAARNEAAQMRRAGDPVRFALPEDVRLTPETHGTWEELPADGIALWRLRIGAPGALSLNLGCELFRLPPGGRLVLHAADGTGPVRAFTAADNRPHGELWTPVVLGDEAVLELTLPLRSRDDYDLVVTRVGKGHDLFGVPREKDLGGCNIDVVCPESVGWETEIAAVGVYTLNGFWACTGTLLNNTQQDGTPYFLTGNHCAVRDANDHTVVVYWNFEAPVCGDRDGGSLDDFQTGSIWRAAFGPADMCLLELEEDPDPTWGVAWAGWSRADVAPASAVCIHHPNSDEKSISFEHDALMITEYYQNLPVAGGNYLRVADWDEGTTEPGSSGAALFDAEHRVVGQLHGGDASCTNDAPDWFGRLASAWDGGGTAASRLSDWLDPLGTAPLTLDAYAPGARGLRVEPTAGLASQGPWHGPFSPDQLVYTLTNLGDQPLDYAVSADQPWITVAGGTGTLAAYGTAQVTVGIGGNAQDLTPEIYGGLVTFTNATDGAGDTQRPVSLQVGTFETRYAWTMDVDPGWAREGLWEWGVPQGLGGSHGYNDPTAGFTGANVLGYNLAGDYEPDLAEQVVTTGPIDCRTLRYTALRYRRWLGVETAVYDSAYVRASVDSVGWVEVWRNGGQVTDPDWVEITHDIAAIADGQQTLYLRWVMGGTDDQWEFCGWNLDDIEIVALEDPTVGIEDPGDDDRPPPAAPGALALRSYPNPFNPRTTIACDVPRDQRLRVAVHDARGRRLRTLHDAPAAAGVLRLEWDGTDDAGRRLATGVYFVRAVGATRAVTHKVTLLK